MPTAGALITSPNVLTEIPTFFWVFDGFIDKVDEVVLCHSLIQSLGLHLMAIWGTDSNLDEPIC
jgi:hypothetical protein